MRSRERKNTSIVDDIAHSLSQNRTETRETREERPCLKRNGLGGMAFYKEVGMACCSMSLIFEQKDIWRKMGKMPELSGVEQSGSTEGPNRPFKPTRSLKIPSIEHFHNSYRTSLLFTFSFL